ncbi:MAG: cache domain-containing protein, partial [Chloroflexi bacterium]|nr:cache domain-containing protein [Chloroflexota bacterium]
MKVQTKFSLGIIIIFAVLAVGIAIMSVNYVNTNTIREAEDRVRIYARAAWEIHNAEIERVLSASEILVQDPIIKDLLQHPGDAQLLTAAIKHLETFRLDQGMDILNLLDADGTVILRTRSPYSVGDSLVADPMIRQAISTRHSSSGNVLLGLDRLDVEGIGMVERCMAVGGEPRGMLSGAVVPILNGGESIGMIQAGNLLNGAAEEVDRIRDAVFKDEYYGQKPVGTATVFMGDLRISTNVMDSLGRRAVGTRVSKSVADHVLGQGLSWTGRAYVVDSWYLSQYDPITDPGGEVIGMLYVGELEQKYLDIRTRAVLSYLSIILVGMVLAFLVFLLLVRSILGPIQDLSQATESLSDGDLTHRVEISGKDEIGTLAASFNHMAERLQSKRQEIERRQIELEEVSSELGVINRNYMEMLGFVAHELKNPLSSAMMGLYTVKDGYLGELNPAQTRSLSSVGQSLDYFQDMIKNYLDLSRLEKGELEVDKNQVTLQADVITPVVEVLERELNEHRMVVENRVSAELMLNVDSDLLRIVYDNLLSNAIKYGRQNGTIRLDAQENRDHVTLSVRNDGRGISPEKMPMLFKKFRRLDTPEYPGEKGSGLGLYICKEII